MSTVSQISFNASLWAAGTGVGIAPGSNGYDVGSVFLDKDGVTVWAFEQNGNAGFGRFNISDGSIVHQGAMFASPGGSFLNNPANSNAGSVFFDQSADGVHYFTIDQSGLLYKFAIGTGSAGNLLDGYCTNPITIDLTTSVTPHITGGELSQFVSTCTWFDAVTNTNYYAWVMQSGPGIGHQYGYVVNADSMTFVGAHDFGKVGVNVFGDKNGDCWFIVSANDGSGHQLTVTKWHPADGATGGALNFTSAGTGPQNVLDTTVGFTGVSWAGYVASSHSMIVAAPAASSDTGNVANIDLASLTRNALHSNDGTFFFTFTNDPGWAALKRGPYVSGLIALPGNLNPDTAQLSGIVNGGDPTALTLSIVSGDLVVTYQPTATVLGSPVYLIKGLFGASSYNITSVINGSGVATLVGNWVGSQKSPFGCMQWIGGGTNFCGGMSSQVVGNPLID